MSLWTMSLAKAANFGSYRINTVMSNASVQIKVTHEVVVRDEADEVSGTSWPSPSVLQASIEMKKLNILPCQCSGNFADAATPMKLKPWPLPWYSPDSDTDRRREAKLILNPTIEEATIMQLVMLWDELEEFQSSSCPSRESESEPAFELRVENEHVTRHGVCRFSSKFLL